MSIWVTSLLTTSEILNMILEKYQITSDQQNYGLFLVKDTGGKVTETSLLHIEYHNIQYLKFLYLIIKPIVFFFLKLLLNNVKKYHSLNYECYEIISLLIRKRFTTRCKHSNIRITSEY